jgi:hypothetical protein
MEVSLIKFYTALFIKKEKPWKLPLSLHIPIGVFELQ